MLSDATIRRCKAAATEALRDLAEDEEPEVGAKSDFLEIKCRLVYLDAQRKAGWRSNADAIAAEMALMGGYAHDLSQYQMQYQLSKDLNNIAGFHMDVDSDSDIKSLPAPLHALGKWRKFLEGLQFGPRYPEFGEIRDKCVGSVDRITAHLLQEEQVSLPGLWKLFVARADGYLKRVRSTPSACSAAATWINATGVLYDDIAGEVGKSPLRKIVGEFLVVAAGAGPDQGDGFAELAAKIRSDVFTAGDLAALKDAVKLDVTNPLVPVWAAAYAVAGKVCASELDDAVADRPASRKHATKRARCE